MRVSLIRLLGLISICFQLGLGNAEKHIEIRKSDESITKDACYLGSDEIYGELFQNGSKKVNINSMYRLLPSGPAKLLFHFEQSKAGAIESINVPLALGIHRPQKISVPINRSVASSTAQIYLNEEFYINRFIEYTVNSLGFPLSYTFLGTCILYTFRSVRNQMGVSSSLPDIYEVAAMALQLPPLTDPDFRKICKQYIEFISSVPKYFSSLNMILQICSQIPVCMEDTTLMNSIVSIREVLANRQPSSTLIDSSNRFVFIGNLKKKYQGRRLNENIVKLFRLTTKLDFILKTYFSEKAVDIFGITDQNQIDSWHQIIENNDENNPNKISCEESLKLHLKTFPIFPGNPNKKRRDYLSNILCTSSEQAVNKFLSPLSPNSISFQYLMYLNEYLELPIHLITRSQCIFYLSASYTGMFPRFEYSTELAVLLDQYDYNKKDEFISNCVENLPKYINLAENTFIPKERIVIDVKRDATEICDAILNCYSKYVLEDNHLMILILSTISSEIEYYNQLLPRSKFILKRTTNSNIEKKFDSKKNSNLLTPKKVISEIMKTQEPSIAIKTQKLYSTLIRLSLLLTDTIQFSEQSKLKRPISFPKEIVETRVIEDVVPTISELSNIISNSLIPSDCANSIINRRPELNKAFNTLVTICDYVLFNSYPNPFSEIPYLLKLVSIASDNFGFSFNQIKRIYAYSASSFVILGVQLRLYPLFLFISRYSMSETKSEYNLCLENFQFGLLFTSSQIQDKQALFCKYVSLVIEDKYFHKNILFAIRTFSKKSIIEEDWSKSLSDLFKELKMALTNSIDSNLQTGLSIGDGTKYYPFFASKLIRRIQRSKYFGELSKSDIIEIFSKIYQNFEFIPTFGSSSFMGNSLRYEFISAKDTSRDMNNSKFVSDQLFGLRYVFSNEIKLEEFSYLVERCKFVLDEFFNSKGMHNIDLLNIVEICKFTFSIPNKELPNQLGKSALFINYLVNYFSIPQQIVPQLYCINKVVNVFTDLSIGNSSFESSLNFGLHLYYLTRGFTNIKESNFNDKCKVAALLSNILDTDVDTMVYDENASIKTNNGLSLEKHITNPINYKYINSFCTAIKQCSKPNVFDKLISDYISTQTQYNFIYEEHLSADPLTSDTKIEENKSVIRENVSRTQFKPKLERLIEKLMIDGIELYTKQNKKTKVQGMRVLEGLRLFGVFHDSFRGLFNGIKVADQIANYSFTGLYSGTSPIKGGNDFIEELHLFTLETSIQVAHEIAQEILSSESEIIEFSHLVLSNHELTIKICKEKLKLILPREFNIHEIFSICSISFSAFKY